MPSAAAPPQSTIQLPPELIVTILNHALHPLMALERDAYPLANHVYAFLLPLVTLSHAFNSLVQPLLFSHALVSPLTAEDYLSGLQEFNDRLSSHGAHQWWPRRIRVMPDHHQSMLALGWQGTEAARVGKLLGEFQETFMERGDGLREIEVLGCWPDLHHWPQGGADLVKVFLTRQGTLSSPIPSLAPPVHLRTTHLSLTLSSLGPLRSRIVAYHQFQALLPHLSSSLRELEVQADARGGMARLMLELAEATKGMSIEKLRVESPDGLFEDTDYAPDWSSFASLRHLTTHLFLIPPMSPTLLFVIRNIPLPPPLRIHLPASLETLTLIPYLDESSPTAASEERLLRALEGTSIKELRVPQGWDVARVERVCRERGILFGRSY